MLSEKKEASIHVSSPEPANTPGQDTSRGGKEAKLAELVMGIQDGSGKATEQLYRLVQPGLRWFLARKLSDCDDALDGV